MMNCPSPMPILRIALVALGICTLSLTSSGPGRVLDSHLWAQDAPGEAGQDAVAPNAAAEQADDTAAVTAILIPVPLPLDGESDLRIMGQIQQALEQFDDVDRPTLILEFQGGTKTSGLSRYERCLSLSRYLLGAQLRRVRTVAYLPSGLSGHAVLVALACEEIVMSPSAELGDAGRHEDLIDASMKAYYREIAQQRRTLSPEMALAMLDPSAGFYSVNTIDGKDSYVNGAELQRLKDADEIVNSNTIVPVGELAKFTGRDLRRTYGYVSRLVDDREQLSVALGIPIKELAEFGQVALDGKAARLELKGPITGAKINRVLQTLRDQRNEEYKRIVLIIDSAGGSPKDSLRLAMALSGIVQDRQRQIITYVDGSALADAAWIALSGSRLTMKSDSQLGGPGEWQPTAKQLEKLQQPLAELANDLSLSASVLLALVDNRFQLFEFSHTTTGEKRYFGVDEHELREDRDQWIRGDRVETAKGLTTARAMELGWCADEFADVAELRQRLNISEEMKTLERNPLIARIESLAMSPWFASTLLSIAFFALMTEVSAPGLGIPGFISALAFLFFFWAQFLNGTVGWLEVVLFVGGVVAILLEIMVIPGVGIFGLGGGLMVLGSVILASQTFVRPENAYQLAQMPRSLYGLIAALTSTMVAAFVMRKYLADAPLFRHLMLKPVADADVQEREVRERVVDFSHLQDKTGVTTTPLRPSGKARIGDDVVDVTCERESIDRDQAIVVVRVQGNKVVVKRLA